MRITLTQIELSKLHPLTISRGTSAGSVNLIIEVEHENTIGMGEMAPTSGGAAAETAATASAAIDSWSALLADLAPTDMQAIEHRLAGQPGQAARAALDIALHDWIGKRCALPLWKLFGLDISRIEPTSLTVGINSLDRIREIVPEILRRTKAQVLKVKLGSPEGPEADQAMFAAAQESAPTHCRWRVDANGGWTPEAARKMIAWLASRNVELVEQPIARGRESDFAEVYRDSPLPIYADESIYTAADIPGLAASIHGVNLKLMKCGGLREALRIIHTARAHGLQVMIGCMSESTLAISAAAHLSPLADVLDLDSHLNLTNDPFEGARYRNGCVIPNALPGLGVQPIRSAQHSHGEPQS